MMAVEFSDILKIGKEHGLQSERLLNKSMRETGGRGQRRLQ